MSDCPICEKRAKIHRAQMEGRKAAHERKKRTDNPYVDEIEKQYWEYGWLEENFMEEIEEHRAVMKYAGQHLFIFCEELNDWVKSGKITEEIKDAIVASLFTVGKNLEDKLLGH